MNLQQAQSYVLQHLRRLVRHGEVTQSGLARHAGLSQAHVNNLLSGVRPMTADVADLVLRALGLDLEDLVPVREGAGVGALLVPKVLEQARRPDVVRVETADAAFPQQVRKGDLLLVERDEARRSRPRWERLYLLQTGRDTLVRRCQTVGGDLVILSADGAPPRTLSIRNRPILEVVVGEVLWVGRTL